MNKKFLKRVAAFAMAATLVIGNAAIALAAEGSSNGTGSNEGGVPEMPADSITLPTAPAGFYNYIVDPNGLILKTKDNIADERHYDWSDFTSGDTLFFKSFVSGASPVYSDTSDSLYIQNESPVDIAVTAKAKAPATYTGAVKFVTGSFTALGAQEIKIGAKGAYQDVNATGDDLGAVNDVAVKYINGLGDSNAANISFDLKGNEKNYELKYLNGKYVYKKITSGSPVWSSGSFCLVGESNTANAATVWDSTSVPSLNVTWSWYNPAKLAGTWDSTATTFKITLPSGVKATAGTDISAITANGKSVASADINADGTVVKLSKDAVKTAVGDDWATTTKFTFAFTLGGKTYGSVITKG